MFICAQARPRVPPSYAPPCGMPAASAWLPPALPWRPPPPSHCTHAARPLRLGQPFGQMPSPAGRARAFRREGTGRALIKWQGRGQPRSFNMCRHPAGGRILCCPRIARGAQPNWQHTQKKPHPRQREEKNGCSAGFFFGGSAPVPPRGVFRPRDPRLPLSSVFVALRAKNKHK